MGSGLIFPNITRWGVLIQELTLTADNANMILSGLLTSGFNYLIVLMSLSSDQPVGDMDWLWQINDAFAIHQTTHFYIEPPNVVVCQDFAGETAFRAPTIGDSTQTFFSQWTVTNTSGILKLVIGHSGMNGAKIYQAYNTVLLDPGQTSITKISLFGQGGKKFKAGSKVSIYGLN